MFTSFLNLWRGSHKDTEDNRYYQAQYNTKLNEIIGSFDNLKNTTQSVINQAVSVTTTLNRKVELFDKRIKTIISNIDEIIIIKTINNQWVAINEKACNVLGIDKDKVIGKTNQDIVTLYPKMNSILKQLSKVEERSWKNMKEQIISIPIDENDHKVKWELLINPIETNDGVDKEIIIIGKELK